MSKKLKSAILLPLIFILAFSLPGLPWSNTFRHKLKKILIKTQIAWNKWQGYEPRLVSIAGETDTPGARLFVLDSHSGWATLCDKQGKFTIPDVLWYPDATYEVVISTADNSGKLLKICAPSELPSTKIIEAGKVEIYSQSKVDLIDLPGDTSYSYEYFDLQNRDYYRRLFEQLTVGKISDGEKVEAVNEYVATRLTYDETGFELGSPRRVLERGSQYCGHLSLTMATLLAVAFPVRVIHLIDKAIPPNSHAVVEVFYDGDWHLYDPTFGVKFKNHQGKVVSYRELMLNPDLITPEVFSPFRQKYPKVPLNPLIGIYSSGYHHFYYLAYRGSQYAHAWWAYKDGLNYVPTGSRVLLAAAGIRPGTRVIYHIRKPGNEDDELTLISRRGATGDNVLNEEESLPINLASGSYEVFVDLYDGNVASDNNLAYISNCHLGVRLEVR